MKKLSILLFVIIISVPAFAGWSPKKKTTPTPAILKQYPFTMTNAEYAKIAQTGKREYIYPKQYMCITKNIMGYNSRLCFLREGQKNQKIFFHIPLKKEKKPREYVRQFNTIKQLLIKKYGTPSSDKFKYLSGMNAITKRKYRKKMDGKPLALSDGYLEYITVWKLDNFTIELKCFKAPNDGVFIDLSYMPPKNMPKAIKVVATNMPKAIKVVATNKKTDPLAEL